MHLKMYIDVNAYCSILISLFFVDFHCDFSRLLVS